MSINPVLARDASNRNELFPLPKPSEFFVLKRDGIAFAANNSERKLVGKGKIFLTNQRIVFLRDGLPEKHKGFTSVELPLDLLSGKNGFSPEFQQPIFGANYLQGNVQPVSLSQLLAHNAPIPLNATTEFSITFNRGGCSTFLRAFYRLHKAAVATRGNNVQDPWLTNQVAMGQQDEENKKESVVKEATKTVATSFENYILGDPPDGKSCLFCRFKAAFYDPNDPSVLYLVQPVPEGGGAPSTAVPSERTSPISSTPAGPRQQQQQPSFAPPPGPYGPPASPYQGWQGQQSPYPTLDPYPQVPPQAPPPGYYAAPAYQYSQPYPSPMQPPQRFQ